jgi:hypothetical protein
MGDLPRPAHAYKEEGGIAQDPSPIRLTPTKFSEVAIGNYMVEYTFRPEKGDMVFHFYKAKSVGGLFPLSFRQRVYTCFTNTFGLFGRDIKNLQIDWVEEFNSWCVRVLLNDMPPGQDTINTLLQNIMS